MRLLGLRLLNVRAHANTSLTFAPKVNLIYGPNGAGKTNILEGIHYLCLAKSFIASKDTYVLRRGSAHFEVEGTFEGEQRSALRVRVAYVPEEGKRAFVNKAPLDRLAELVGLVPVVVLAPEDRALTNDGPDERRRFIDNTLSQARPVYLNDLVKYRRALKQRNALLFQLKRQRRTAGDGVLDSWNEELITLGSRLIVSRQKFVDEFAAFMGQAYALIDSIGEEPGIAYQTIEKDLDLTDESAVNEAFRRRLRRVQGKEVQQGRSLVGPHRDELLFTLNAFEVRRFASQGQHRTFAMALKLAKYFYLRERLNETPLLLLDDVFGDLDERRTDIFLGLLAGDDIGQSVVTGASRRIFDTLMDFSDPAHQAVRIEGGQAETQR